MPLHDSTFEYLQPTPEQIERMSNMRVSAKVFADAIDAAISDGPDKTYIMRKFREVMMWVNVAITRHPDGAPRS